MKTSDFRLMAQSGHADRADECPLSGVKRTWAERDAMSACDPNMELASFQSLPDSQKPLRRISLVTVSLERLGNAHDTPEVYQFYFHKNWAFDHLQTYCAPA
jgi:hypothetical protein